MMQTVTFKRCHLLSAAIFLLCTITPPLYLISTQFKSAPKVASVNRRKARLDASNATLIRMQTLLERAAVFSTDMSRSHCGVESIEKPWLDRFGGHKKERDAEFYQRLIHLTVAVHQQLTDHNIFYVTSEGTTLGTLFFHDTIPWDDDSDLLVFHRDVPRILLLLNQIEGVVCDEKVREGSVVVLKAYYNNHDVRLRDLNEMRVHNYFWSLPFVDLAILGEDRGSFYRLQEEEGTRFIDSDIFPRRLRPFGSYWLYGPNKPYTVMRAEYESTFGQDLDFPCRLSSYDHVHERWVDPVPLDCEEISRQYPVVHVPTARAGGSSRYVEVVRMGDKTLYTCNFSDNGEYGLAHVPLKFPPSMRGIGQSVNLRWFGYSYIISARVAQSTFVITFLIFISLLFYLLAVNSSTIKRLPKIIYRMRRH